MQKQIHEKERRLRKEENKDSIIEALRREIELLRASQPSTSRRDLDPPTTQLSNQHVPRHSSGIS